jgi:hypothetical protein
MRSTGGEQVKALSIQQPWAWLIVNGHKPVENRRWKTGYQGPLAIHAGKQFDRLGYDFVKSSFPDIEMPEPEAFERGGMVGTVEMTGCVTSSDNRFFFGPYGFILENARPCRFVPMIGKLSFFEVELEIS